MNGAIKWVMKSRLYPAVFQWPTLIIFALITYQLLFGVSSAHDNFGTAMTWVLWWPLIPLLFLAAGRFWCGVCPFGTLSDFVQKIVGHNRPIPKFLKNYGIWIIDIFFILITWGDHVFGIVESPRGSGVMMLIIITGVVAAAGFYERRAWCKYLCFLGGVAGNYSRAGVLELRATPATCSKCTTMSCYKGSEKAAGCPMFVVPRTMDNMANCNLCGSCLKNCPNDSIGVSTRIPSRELWFIRAPRFQESFLAIIIMGIVFVQNITMLEIWAKAQSWLEHTLGTTNYAVTFTVTFIIAMAIPVALLFSSSWVGARLNGESTVKNFARFGYALIPLDLAGHLAHNLFHLLAEGKSIFITGLALVGTNWHSESTALVNLATIQVLQFTLLGLGGLASIYTAYRIARTNYGAGKGANSYWPYVTLFVIFVLFNVYLFLLPMAHRM